MKKKLLVVICFVLAIVIISGCKNKSGSQAPNEPNAAAKNIETEKPVLEQPVTSPPVNTPKPELVSLETRVAVADPVASEDDSNDTEYFALYMDDHKIGHAIQTRVVEDNKVITTVKLVLTLSRTGIPITVETTSTSMETVDGKPLGFELEQNLGIIMTKTEGKILDNGKLLVTEGDKHYI